MARYIDADALIEAMKKTEEEYENMESCPNWFTALRVIKEQPTAYDVEKVEIEIRHCSGKGYRDIDGDYVPPMIKTDTAIGLVRRGGINE